MSSGKPYLYLSPPKDLPVQIPVEGRPFRPLTPPATSPPPCTQTTTTPAHLHLYYGSGGPPTGPVWVRTDGTHTEWTYRNPGGHHYCAHEARGEGGRVVTTHEACGGTNLAVRYDETRDGRQTWVINQYDSSGAPRPLPKPAPPAQPSGGLFSWCTPRAKADALAERDAALARYEDARQHYDELVRAAESKRNHADWTRHIAQMERAYAEGVRAAHLAHLPHHCVFHPVHYSFDPCNPCWPRPR